MKKPAISSGRSTMDRPNASAARRILGLVGKSRSVGVATVEFNGITGSVDQGYPWVKHRQCRLRLFADALPKLTALPTLKPERRKGLSKRLAADKVECRCRLPFWHFSYALEGATVRIPRVIHR